MSANAACRRWFVLALVAPLLVVAEAAPHIAARADAADFNGDGFQDLAVAAPSTMVGEAPGAAAVYVYPGGSSGLRTNAPQILTQDTAGVNGEAENNDSFGSSLAWGDFDRDGFSDLAIGINGESTTAGSNVGAVAVVYGSASGLNGARDRTFTKGSASDAIPGTAAAGDGFGTSLAVGNFGRSAHQDLAIGVAGDSEQQPGSGAAIILYGNANGLQSNGAQYFGQDQPGVPGVSESFDAFGYELAAADLGRSRFADLAIGAIGEDDEGASVFQHGTVTILYGSDAGLTATNSQLWRRGKRNVPGPANTDSAFGSRLVAANFGRSTQADLAVAAHLDTVGGEASAGSVTILYGSDNGITSADAQVISQDTPGISNDAEATETFGVELAAGELGGSGHRDLAIGVPGEASAGIGSAGSVHVLYGSANGLVSSGDDVFSQSTPGVTGEPEPNDFFGAGLAAVNVTGSTRDDLMVGVPREDDIRGLVHVLPGTPGGVTTSGALVLQPAEAPINALFGLNIA